jgi:hypothetical protein
MKIAMFSIVPFLVTFCALNQNTLATNTLYVAAGPQQGSESVPTIYKIDLALKKIIDKKSYGHDIATGLAKLGPNFILTTTTISTSKMVVISPEDLGVRTEIPFDVSLLSLVQPQFEGPVWVCGQDREHRNFFKKIELSDKGFPEAKAYEQSDESFFVTQASAFSKTQNWVYTALSHKAGGPIIVFDASTGKKLREIKAIPSPWMPSYLRSSADGKYLFLQLYNSNTKETRLGVVDSIVGKLLKQLVVPAQSLVLSSTGEKLFVLGVETEELAKVVVVDTINLDILDEITIGNTVDVGVLNGGVASKDDKYVAILFSGHGSLGKTQPGYLCIVNTLSKEVNYIALEVGAPVGAIILP